MPKPRIRESIIRIAVANIKRHKKLYKEMAKE